MSPESDPPLQRNTPVEQKLAVILAADVVGYSTLMERDEIGTFERIRADRLDLWEPQVSSRHGRIFKLMGDGLLAEFGSVIQAVECAAGKLLSALHHRSVRW